MLEVRQFESASKYSAILGYKLSLVTRMCLVCDCSQLLAIRNNRTHAKPKPYSLGGEV